MKELKQADGESTEEFQIRKLAFEKEQANNKDEYSNEDVANLKAFASKARQNELEAKQRLADKDPKEILNFDTETQNKVIKKLYGYENLRELKIMSPDIFEKEVETNEKREFNKDWDLEEFKRRQALLEYKLGSKEVDDEYDKFVNDNKSAVETIPDFRDKVYKELEYISNSIPHSERMQKATKIVSSSSNIEIETFLSLQWRKNIKTHQTGSNSWGSSEDKIKELRKQLGLKEK